MVIRPSRALFVPQPIADYTPCLRCSGEPITRAGSLATALKDRNSKCDNGATLDGMKVLQSRSRLVRAGSVKEVQIGLKIQLAKISLYLGGSIHCMTPRPRSCASLTENRHLPCFAQWQPTSGPSLRTLSEATRNLCEMPSSEERDVRFDQYAEI